MTRSFQSLGTSAGVANGRWVRITERQLEVMFDGIIYSSDTVPVEVLCAYATGQIDGYAMKAAAIPRVLPPLTSPVPRRPGFLRTIWAMLGFVSA